MFEPASPDPAPLPIGLNSLAPRLRVVRYEGESETAAAASPSLIRSTHPSFAAQEMKFLVREEVAREVAERLATLLAPDPHGDTQAGYRIRTLYCDTANFDVYHRRGRYGLFKFRVRRYGDSEEAFLERKSKRGTTVRKRRTTIAINSVERFAQNYARQGDEVDWYHWQICRNKFQPAAFLEYARSAYFGQCSEGPLRLTFDRQVQGAVVSQWSLAEPVSMQSLIPDYVVCEFKYRGSLPAPFKQVVQDLQLVPQGVSKYRRCLQAFNAVASEAENA